MVMLSFDWDLAQSDTYLPCVFHKFIGRGRMFLFAQWSKGAYLHLCILIGREVECMAFYQLKAFAPIVDVRITEHHGFGTNCL